MGKLIQFRKKRPKINDSNPNFYAKGCLIHVNIYEEEIINKDISKLQMISDMLMLKLQGEDLKDKIKVEFKCYNDDLRQYFEIPEIREYAKLLLKEVFPIYYMFCKETRVIFFLSCAEVNIDERNYNEVTVTSGFNDFMFRTLFGAAKVLGRDEEEIRRMEDDMFKTVGFNVVKEKKAE